jgi:hypothetical protein
MNARGERRRSTRLREAGEHGVLQARVRPGHTVDILDVSAGGALIETERRLLPGSVVDLHLATSSGHMAMRGQVLRCAVARLSPTLVAYRGAIGFERHLPWLGSGEGAGAVGSRTLAG